jgi:hypothetical protein
VDIDIVTTEKDIQAIIEMARIHPNPEYDCTFDYMIWVLSQLTSNPNLRGWVLKDGNEYVGYSVGILSKNIIEQVNMFDIYLKPEYRGRNNILMFIDSWDAWARISGVKRVVWMSRRPMKVFTKYLRKDIQTYYTYIQEV